MSICLDGRHAKDKMCLKRQMIIPELPAVQTKSGANKLV